MNAVASRHRLLISVAVMSATVMQVIDTTIVNVALPQMQGQLGATPDQISWVLTSYMVSSGIFMPLTGYFTDRAGQKRYLMLSIIGFTITSALCGLSANLVELVLFRVLQGVFGAALVPLSQAIMVRSYPAEERGRAMAIWGVGVMVGPILGPTLGGYLTEMLSWRWTFFINLPVGILSLFLTWRFVPDSERRERVMDWMGLLLLALTATTVTVSRIPLGPLNIVAALAYTIVAFDRISWEAAGLIAIGSLIGGFLGAHYGRRLSPNALRAVIVVVGLIGLYRLLSL